MCMSVQTPVIFACCLVAACQADSVKRFLQTRHNASANDAAVADECYGELSNLAAVEGNGVGQELSTSSSTECQAACTNNANCQSFSLCPQWNACWMKDRALTGNEATVVNGQCKTYYKRACSPQGADTCYGDFPNLVAQEGNGVGQELSTTSSIECQTACTNNADCQSFSLCPQWNACWMKDKVLTGNEATVVNGQCKTYYKRACTGTPVPTPAPGGTPVGTAPYCGIAASVYECRAEVERLRAIDPTVGNSFEGMCMGYGGTHPPAHLGKTPEDKDPCTLNINNDCDHWFPVSGQWRCDPNYGISKNPDDCSGHYFFLWDEPMTQGLNAFWAADQWKTHVDTWGPQIASMRARGTRITTPLFTDHQGPAREKFQRFFERCGSGCNDPNSKYYIDVLGTNQWLLNPASNHRDQEQWIKNEVNQIRHDNGNRPVILGNFAWLGASTADQQAEAIANSRIWDKSWSGLEAVFYFGARDFGGGTSNNFLYSQTSSGSTVGAALISRCRAYN